MPRIAYGNFRNSGSPIALGAAPEDVLALAEGGSVEYQYPNGLDLRPGSDLHDRLVAEIITRAQESFDVMASRRKTWSQIDDKLTAFIDLDEKEKALKAKDKRKPVSIVIPLSYATLQTLLTYWVNTFSQQEVLFGFEPTGPEDAPGTIMLEQVIKFQSAKMKHLLSLHTMWRSSLAYGIGYATPIWTVKKGKKTVPQAVMGLDFMTGQQIPIDYIRNTVDAILFEGNDILPIDNYTVLPDPNVSAHRIQDGEFFGFVEKSNIMRCLTEEADDPNTFNVEYVKHLKACESRFIEETDTKRDKLLDEARSMTTNNRVDKVHMYITIIPREWNLSESSKPEKWLFTIAGDRILIRAQALNLDHNMYPVVACAPDFDGFSAAPMSSVETVFGCQELIDFLMNSHVANVRKALNDMFVVDPYMINLNDLKTPGPGKLIRTRRSAWGRGVKDAMAQFPVTDVTSNHVRDIDFVAQLVQQVTGASDILQGVQRRTSERVTRAEVVSTQTAALSRIERGARVGAMMAHSDLAYMMASQTQQLMRRDMVVKTTGRWQEQLMMEYGMFTSGNGQFLPVRPIDIQVDFDVLPQDAPMKGQQYVDSWMNLLGQLTQNPALALGYDIPRILKHVARLTGVNDLINFTVPMGMASGMAGPIPPTQTQVVPDDVLAQRVQSGRYAAIENVA